MTYPSNACWRGLTKRIHTVSKTRRGWREVAAAPGIGAFVGLQAIARCRVVGAVMMAEGKSSGNGVVKITRAERAKGIWYDLDFEHGT